MALFVLGAGATRGCSFVDATKDPCLPPLDGDFFTQLQRVRNVKHRPLITEVMKDVVELFGPNFGVTMEAVFVTLEHTVRMLETTGENRDFKLGDLKKKRDRLMQAIGVVLEDSLANRDEQGHSSRTPRDCEHHKVLVNMLKQGDDVISLNYDCVIDYALKAHGNQKWNARYGYGLKLGARGKALSGDEHWQPARPAAKDETVHLYKLHGSMHFKVSGALTKERVDLKQRPYTRQAGSLRFSIIPPEWHKAYYEGVFAGLWKQAASAIHRAKQIVFVGYSLPPTDLHSTALFRTSTKKGALKALIIVNPDQPARHRTRVVMQRGFSPKTRVLSFGYFDEFLAADRSTWDF